MNNPLINLKTRFFRSKQQPTQLDPQLEAAFQHLKSQLPPVAPSMQPASEQQLRSMFRMALNYALQVKATENPNLMRTARTITYNLCPDCMANRSQSLQNDQQPLNPYRLQLDPTPQQNVPPTPVHTQLEAKKEESRQWGTAIRMNLKDPSTANILPAISPHMAHKIQQMSTPVDISQVPTGDITPAISIDALKGMVHHPLQVEDVSWLNSQPVTPDKVPVVETDEERATVTGLPALRSQLRHLSNKRN